ncbi:MAG TPA: DUF6265 family protein [Casimicrobiaceae bacterium]|nr:DUF6265 family protein [Casimicrobiaceae bacterium]
MNSQRSKRRRVPVLVLAACASLAGCAQPEAPTRATPPAATPDTRPAATPAAPTASSTSPAAAAATPAATGPLAPLAWLAGCWQGNVNEREFREMWLPLRGGMLIGAGQQVLRGVIQDYEFLRIDARSDGVYFTQFSGDRRESSFKLSATTADGKDTLFTFANTAAAFPARLVYRHGVEGWLYETIEGPLNGSDKKVIYPLRRVDCGIGELVTK